MEEKVIECTKCSSTVEDTADVKLCGLCNEVHCGDCLNEAGFCIPCGQQMEFSKEEAIAV